MLLQFENYILSYLKLIAMAIQDIAETCESVETVKRTCSVIFFEWGGKYFFTFIAWYLQQTTHYRKLLSEICSLG